MEFKNKRIAKINIYAGYKKYKELDWIQGVCIKQFIDFCINKKVSIYYSLFLILNVCLPNKEQFDCNL